MSETPEIPKRKVVSAEAPSGKMNKVAYGTRRNADAIASSLSVIFVWLTNDVFALGVPIEVLAAFTSLIGAFMARFSNN